VVNPVQVAFDVPFQRVEDLLSCALDSGGANYWARVVQRSGVFGDGGSITFVAHDDGVPYYHTNGLGRFVLDAASTQAGLRIMASKCGRHFGNWMDENEDAETGDVFLQCCLFGEVVFG
jgi:hypothetical protein